jgi:hypothetical protein
MDKHFYLKLIFGLEIKNFARCMHVLTALSRSKNPIRLAGCDQPTGDSWIQSDSAIFPCFPCYRIYLSGRLSAVSEMAGGAEIPRFSFIVLPYKPANFQLL